MRPIPLGVCEINYSFTINVSTYYGWMYDTQGRGTQ